jgi:hypothetical protein
MKTMLITFFDIKGIVHFEFIPQGQRLTAWRYSSCYMKLCIEKRLNSGPIIRFPTMIMLQFTRLSLSSSFWPKNRLPKWDAHPFLTPNDS